MNSPPRSTSTISSTKGPDSLPNVETLVESMKGMLREDLDNMLKTPWLVEHFLEIVEDLQSLATQLTPLQLGFLNQVKMVGNLLISDLPFIQSLDEASHKNINDLKRAHMIEAWTNIKAFARHL
ncbi:hypothetical protein TSUD_288260 [Trifolium subterraneum]|uniref:Uncharacterized protein n=1 Tax=Trifolium subterraneum TaxID=3900 RepID=A0A2Z6NBS9_TRISU|nr:hypothetical protein TSUD_288260 [Trifolium subterraneum]